MTTGRINQVTIFERPSPEYMGPAPSARGSSVVHKKGCGTPGEAPGPRTESKARHRPHPFATTEFSRSRSAEAVVLYSASACPPQKEATHRRSHQKTATSTRACPQLRQYIDGHRPITHRILRRSTLSDERAGFGRFTPPRRRVSAGARQPTAQACKTVTKGLPISDSANAVSNHKGTIVRSCDLGNRAGGSDSSHYPRLRTNQYPLARSLPQDVIASNMQPLPRERTLELPVAPPYPQPAYPSEY